MVSPEWKINSANALNRWNMMRKSANQWDRTGDQDCLMSINIVEPNYKAIEGIFSCIRSCLFVCFFVSALQCKLNSNTINLYRLTVTGAFEVLSVNLVFCLCLHCVIVSSLKEVRTCFHHNLPDSLKHIANSSSTVTTWPTLPLNGSKWIETTKAQWTFMDKCLLLHMFPSFTSTVLLIRSFFSHWFAFFRFFVPFFIGEVRFKCCCLSWDG